MTIKQVENCIVCSSRSENPDSIRRKEALVECVAYFKSKKGFHRLMNGLKEKYVSLGHIGGTMILSHLSSEEKETLEGFFGKNFREHKSATISAAKFQEALNHSRFDGVSLEELLQSYFGGLLETKKERLSNLQRKYKDFFQNILKDYQNTLSGRWLLEVVECRGNEYQYLIQKYKESKTELEILLRTTLSAGNALPVLDGHKERLAVFAAKQCGDPHYFDEGTSGNRLLTYIIRKYVTREGAGSNHTINSNHVYSARKEYYQTELKNELFYYAGLLKDDISNYTMIYGLRCRKENGEFHQGVEGYCKERQPVFLTLLTLGEVVSIQPAQSKRSMQWEQSNQTKRLEQSNQSELKKVYIVENPAVFAELAATVPEGTSLVCTNGQLRLASLVLLDLLYKEGYQMYYAGDFDPEGLVIADRLKRRYEEQLYLWRYGVEDYRYAISNVKLSELRLKKLQGLGNSDLIRVGKYLEEEKLAGYQEKLIPWYEGDIFSTPKVE